jgi:hypothetical protein
MRQEGQADRGSQGFLVLLECSPHPPAPSPMRDARPLLASVNGLW